MLIALKFIAYIWAVFSDNTDVILQKENQHTIKPLTMKNLILSLSLKFNTPHPL